MHDVNLGRKNRALCSMAIEYIRRSLYIWTRVIPVESEVRSGGAEFRYNCRKRAVV